MAQILVAKYIELYEAAHMLRYKKPLEGSVGKKLSEFKKHLEAVNPIDDKTAFEVFYPIFKKYVSKAELAQNLSLNLLNLFKSESVETVKEYIDFILEDDYLDYLIQAILHVTGESKESIKSRFAQEEGVEA